MRKCIHQLLIFLLKLFKMCGRLLKYFPWFFYESKHFEDFNFEVGAIINKQFLGTKNEKLALKTDFM